MAKTLGGLIAYMAIGGLLCGPLLMKFSRECHPVSVTEGAAVMATWPAFFVAALVSDTGRKSTCKPATQDREEAP